MTQARIPFRITDRYQVEELVGRSRGGRPCVRLLSPVEYRVGDADSDEAVIAPAGFETDFASIPWGLWNVFPPWGPYARPAILHDFLYRTRGSGLFDGRRWITRPDDYSRKAADRIFLEAMAVVGVAWPKRQAMHAAVRAGGWIGWGG